MAPYFCANRPTFCGLLHLGLGFESLEARRLLSVSQMSETDLSYQLVVLMPTDPAHQSQDIVRAADQVADEFWAELNRREILRVEEIVSEHEQPDGGSLEPAEPLPAIPIDDSIDPFTDCPGLDGGFCLPGDANQDGDVDFLDFLKLGQNFGSSGATWEDGDFDGDGRVTFHDFLILSSWI